MREAIVFQTSSTRLKETEFLKSLVASSNIAAWLNSRDIQQEPWTNPSPRHTTLVQDSYYTFLGLNYLNTAKSSVSVLGSDITRLDPNIFIALGWHLVWDNTRSPGIFIEVTLPDCQESIQSPDFYYAKQMLLLRCDVAINNADMVGASLASVWGWWLPCIAGGPLTGYNTGTTPGHGWASVISFQPHLSYLRPLTPSYQPQPEPCFTIRRGLTDFRHQAINICQ